MERADLIDKLGKDLAVVAPREEFLMEGHGNPKAFWVGAKA